MVPSNSRLILPYRLQYYRALVPKCPCISPGFEFEHAVQNIAYIGGLGLFCKTLSHFQNLCLKPNTENKDSSQSGTCRFTVSGVDNAP